MRRLLSSLPLTFLSIMACSAPAPDGGSPSPLDAQKAAIVGGVVDKDYDSVVLLAIDQGNGGICTGTLIAPNLVLTARHCVSNNVTEGIGCDIDGNSNNGDHVSFDYLASSIGVYGGSSPAFWLGEPTSRGVKLFHPPGKNLCNNDIALILLDKPVSFAEPMKMRLNYGAQIGEKATAIGYGKTSTDNDFSSGTRHRRENITILSVGQDWNHLLGANEFVMGQSTCQGDSGGPILAQDTKAILGVTSRGGNCETGEQRFTRLDAHKDLIEAALAEAGATALLEGLEPPAPQPINVTGKGPCTTGAECSALFCDTSTSTCSALCGPGSGFCASGQICKAIPFEISGQLITEQPICAKYEAVDSCDSCRLSKCKAAAEKCYADPACTKMIACVAACTTVDCYDACAAGNNAGAAVYEETRTCECSAKCSKPCGGVCGKEPAGTGGSGGAGGDPGGEGGAAGDPGGEGGAAGDPGGEGGAAGDPGSEGGAAGDPGSEGGSAGTGTAAGSGGKAAGSGGSGPTAGSSPGAGAGGVSAGGTTTGPQTQPVASSGDDGGCSASGRPAGQGAWALGLLGLSLLRRRSRR